ncbi:MAG: DUF2185 domain-containing protein [Crocinitomix sp.]|nr:DUF2185 domain-containing protein [Crocinitomix sp.]
MFNKTRKRKKVTLNFIEYVESQFLNSDLESVVLSELRQTVTECKELVEFNEWGLAFENISEKLIEHFIILDREGIELAKEIIKLSGISTKWEYDLRRITSIGYITDSWCLTDSEALSNEFKYTFYKPSRKITDQLAVGNLVKLTFEFLSKNEEHPSAERMWVIITEVNNGKFQGVLDNSPFYIHDLFAGDEIDFEHKHIIDDNLEIIEDSLVEKYRDICMVTNRVLEGKELFNYMYREEPIEKDDERDCIDTGWRIFIGDEPQEYLDNTDNVSMVSIGQILNIDDSIIPILQSKVGSSFERNKNGQFDLIVE